MSDVQSNTSNAFQQLREISELITRLKQLEKFVREIFSQH